MWCLQHGTTAVNDVCCSPNSSTVLASVSKSVLSVWDLSERAMDPIVTVDMAVMGRQLSAVTFARNAPVIVVGDKAGAVTVYLMSNMVDRSCESREEQARRLVDHLSTD